jgi:hypothetical protein
MALRIRMRRTQIHHVGVKVRGPIQKVRKSIQEVRAEVRGPMHKVPVEDFADEPRMLYTLELFAKCWPTPGEVKSIQSFARTDRYHGCTGAVA